VLSERVSASVTGTSHSPTSRMSRTHPPRSLATPTIGWLRQSGSRASKPRRQAVKDAPVRSPAARIVQSSARCRYFTTYRSPSITTRSSSAPDLPAPSAIGSRSDTPASSSSTEAALARRQPLWTSAPPSQRAAGQPAQQPEGGRSANRFVSQTGSRRVRYRKRPVRHRRCKGDIDTLAVARGDGRRSGPRRGADRHPLDAPGSGRAAAPEVVVGGRS